MSKTFADLGVPADLVAVLARNQRTTAFPIQEATLPDALAGADICGKAPTGSGKTLAFGIALAVHTRRAEPRRPTALVLVPTRELANQVRDELVPLAQVRRLRVAAVFGGVGYGNQFDLLRKGVDILVACPGRLEDLVDNNHVRLDDVRMVVVDEADRMADMGFLPAVKRLLDRTNDERQTLLFSATLDGDVDVLVRRYQHRPLRHEVVSGEADRGDVRHLFWRTDRAGRVELTARLVAGHWPAIVFSRTKHGADRLTRQLAQYGVDAVAIHGNRSQGQRERALKAFADGHAQALVATDVAARGIHVDQVALVVHFDPAATDKDYVHRSGRTGRAGTDGLVVSLAMAENVALVKSLQRDLGEPQRLDDPVEEELGHVEVGAVSRNGSQAAGEAAGPRATVGAGGQRTQPGRRGRGGGAPGRRSGSRSGSGSKSASGARAASGASSGSGTRAGSGPRTGSGAKAGAGRGPGRPGRRSSR